MKKAIRYEYTVSQVRCLYNLYSIMYDNSNMTNKYTVYVKKNVDELFNVLRLYDPYFNRLILQQQKLEYEIKENTNSIISCLKMLYYKYELNKINNEIININAKPRNNRFDDVNVVVSLYTISDN